MLRLLLYRFSVFVSYFLDLILPFNKKKIIKIISILLILHNRKEILWPLFAFLDCYEHIKNDNNIMREKKTHNNPVFTLALLSGADFYTYHDVDIYIFVTLLFFRFFIMRS